MLLVFASSVMFGIATDSKFVTIASTIVLLEVFSKLDVIGNNQKEV